MMAYLISNPSAFPSNFGSTLGGNILDKVKSAFSPPPEPPPKPEIELDYPDREVPEDPADYQQDPNCPEGKWMPPGSPNCVDDPIYIELMERLSAELRDLEERERKAAERARIAEAQEKLRQEAEARRIQMDEQRRLQRIREEEQVQMLTVYALVGMGVLMAVTLVVKLVL